ncbi:MAG: hypothetical protein JWO47_731 [Candidatus Saccharibacteria bacterium]|nr:hypothetical protein [Candidatus Saccharibacteria bacterium]
MNNGNPKIEEVGRELYAANMAVHLGGEAVKEVLANKPIDEVALAAERANLHTQRIGRNAILGRLNQLKADEVLPEQETWIH